jgi:hypothetical protein
MATTFDTDDTLPTAYDYDAEKYITESEALADQNHEVYFLRLSSRISSNMIVAEPTGSTTYYRTEVPASMLLGPFLLIINPPFVSAAFLVYDTSSIRPHKQGSQIASGVLAGFTYYVGDFLIQKSLNDQPTDTESRREWAKDSGKVLWAYCPLHQPISVALSEILREHPIVVSASASALDPSPTRPEVIRHVQNNQYNRSWYHLPSRYSKVRHDVRGRVGGTSTSMDDASHPTKIIPVRCTSHTSILQPDILIRRFGV